MTMESLYAAPDLVLQALAPRQDVTPAILDVGTGAGFFLLLELFIDPHPFSIRLRSLVSHRLKPRTNTGIAKYRCRAIEMAQEFPHASVVGLDLVPPTLTSWVILYYFC
jgi:hypothetical protein